ncbi:helix-turn-helix transcriptional regulator [Kribbella kalugense]|uniref:Helix-turn-helix protein n=1 Tax=Kribbella kalugense TaxID=2512221 RepID=A0A4R8A3G7_9ACTN|nr:helix-turn-helix transcriptional regulator [Kribbella kalugense]TDW24181.1 helix-turn-helix protein [Kribbella kalugense]
MDHFDRDALATFLRHRRALVKPADVGLEAGPRRRTPGLRRQELAELAGMSVDYYVRLEQGRGPRPSTQMLTAIGRALQLSDAERDYMHHLAGTTRTPRMEPGSEVRSGVLHLIESLDDTPVLVCNARYDVLAWNRMATALLGDFAAQAPAERNIIWRFFTDPDARARHDEAGAAQFARESVADLRAAKARYPNDERLTSLIRRLSDASVEFRDLWDQIDVETRRSTRKRLHHPYIGWINLNCDALHDPGNDHWIILYTAPAGTSDREALRLLNVIGSQDLAPRQQPERPAG